MNVSERRHRSSWIARLQSGPYDGLTLPILAAERLDAAPAAVLAAMCPCCSKPAVLAPDDERAQLLGPPTEYLLRGVDGSTAIYHTSEDDRA